MDNYGLFGHHHGCLGIFLRSICLTGAILYITIDVQNWLAWLILACEAFEIFLYIGYRKSINSYIRRRYYRKDSFWSKKHNEDEPQKDK